MAHHVDYFGVMLNMERRIDGQDVDSEWLRTFVFFLCGRKWLSTWAVTKLTLSAITNIGCGGIALG